MPTAATAAKKKSRMLRRWSNVATVRRRAARYFGSDDAELRLSTRRAKKYMVRPPPGVGGADKWVHFGEMGYEDFTKHGDAERRRNYLRRSARIRGQWRGDKYSANNLVRRILW